MMHGFLNINWNSTAHCALKSNKKATVERSIYFALKVLIGRMQTKKSG